MDMHNHFLWDSIALSNVGMVRKLNEDACLARPDDALWVVADGMGGHSSGDLASNMIVDTFRALRLPDQLGERIDLLEDGLLDINLRLLDEARRRGDNTTIGSTVVIFHVYEEQAVLLWAGDSRGYLFRDGQLTRITQDHTQVEELVEQGLLLREDAENHPAANVVTRAVGAMDELYVDMDHYEVQVGDTFLLCSDGLNKEVEEEEITQLLARGENAQISAQQLLDLALSRGARDNVTLVIARALEKMD
jgi:serine/threonine protein phosphatase PrpC